MGTQWGEAKDEMIWKIIHIYTVLCLAAQWCPTLCDPMDCRPLGSSVHGDSPGKNTGVGSLSLLQGIFPTQGLNPSLLHCRQMLYHLSHQGSPRILGWVAYPFSRGSSWSRNRIEVSCVAGRFFPRWTTRKALLLFIMFALVSFVTATRNMWLVLSFIVLSWISYL